MCVPSYPEIAIVGDGISLINGSVDVVYNERLFQWVGTHSQCFNGSGINKVVGGSTVHESLQFGRFVPHVNS